MKATPWRKTWACVSVYSHIDALTENKADEKEEKSAY